MDLAKLNIEINSASTLKGVEALTKLEVQSKLAEIATGALEVASKKNAVALGRLDAEAKKTATALERNAVTAQKNTVAWEKNIIAFDKNAALKRRAIAEHQKAENAILREELAAKRLAEQLGKMNEKLNQQGASLTKMSGAVSGVTNVMGSLVGIIATLIGVNAASDIINIADSFNQLQAKVKNVLPDLAEFPAVMASIQATSNKTGVSMASVAQGFVRLEPAGKSIGATTKQVLAFNDAFIKAGIISGATSEEVQNAAIQMAQGIASGTLRGDELRSVMEQMPTVARMISDEMKKVGETSEQAFRRFRKEAADGKITADVVFNAILKNQEKINKQFDALPPGVNRAMGALQNSFTLFVASVNDALGGTSALAKMIQDLANWFNQASEFVRDHAVDLRAVADSSLRVLTIFKDLFVMGMSVQMTFVSGSNALEEYNSQMNSLVSDKNGVRQFFFGLAEGIDRITTNIRQTINTMQTMAENAALMGNSIRNGTLFSDYGYLAKSNTQSGELRNNLLESQFNARSNERRKAMAQAMAGDVLGGTGVVPLAPGGNIAPPPGLPDEKMIAKIKKFKEEVEAAYQASIKLYDAQRQGNAAFEAMSISVEAADKVRQAGLKISQSEIQALEAKIALTKQLTNATTAEREAKEIEIRLSELTRKREAFSTGGALGLYKQEQKIGIEQQLRSMKLDKEYLETVFRSGDTDLYQKMLALRNETGKALAKESVTTKNFNAEKLIDNLQNAFDNQKKLNEAQLEGGDSLRQVTTYQEAYQQVLNANIEPTSELAEEYFRLAESLSVLKKQFSNDAQDIQNTRTYQGIQALMGARRQGLSRNPFTGEFGFFAFEEQQRENRRREQAFGRGLDPDSESGQSFIKGLKQTDDAALSLDALIQKQEQVLQVANQIGGAFSNAFQNAVTGAQSLGDTLRQLGMDIVKILIDIAIRKLIAMAIGNIANAFMGGGGGGVGGGIAGAAIGGFADGGVFSRGKVIPFARGGIVDSATLFPMAGNTTGLMGEAGPEAIMPLQRGADGGLGVRAIGGGGGAVFAPTINIAVDGGGSGDKEKDAALAQEIAKTFRAEIKGMITDEMGVQLRDGGMLNPGVAS